MARLIRVLIDPLFFRNYGLGSSVVLYAGNGITPLYAWTGATNNTTFDLPASVATFRLVAFQNGLIPVDQPPNIVFPMSLATDTSVFFRTDPFGRFFPPVFEKLPPTPTPPPPVPVCPPCICCRCRQERELASIIRSLIQEHCI